MATQSSYAATSGSTLKNTIKEDVSDIIANISPTDTPFFNAAGRRNVGTTTFEWLSEVLPSPASTNKQVEGVAFSSDAPIVQTRLSNVTQISVRNAEVTGTQQATSNYGYAQEMAHQLTLAGRILRNDVEASLVSNNHQISGDFAASAAARQTRGIEHWIQTNKHSVSGYSFSNATTALTDGTTPVSLTEALTETVLQTCYEAGAEPDTVMINPALKNKVSAFTGRASTQVIVDPSTVSKNVTLYASDFGDVKVVMNRKVRNRTALLLDFEFIDVAFLRPFTKQNIAKVGDTEREQLVVEYGLVCKQESALGKVADVAG